MMAWAIGQPTCIINCTIIAHVILFGSCYGGYEVDYGIAFLHETGGREGICVVLGRNDGNLHGCLKIVEHMADLWNVIGGYHTFNYASVIGVVRPDRCRFKAEQGFV